MKESNTSQRLKQLMDERSLKQVDILNLTKPFCQKYGIKMNKSDISQYLSGRATPNQDKLVMLSMALHVNEAWLMGYDVPITPAFADSGQDLDSVTQAKAADSQKLFSAKEEAFLHQLNVLGWICQPEARRVETTGGFIFQKDGTSFCVSQADYLFFIEDSTSFFNQRLEELFEKSKILLFPRNEKPYLIPEAAHERTDVEVTDTMRRHDDDIMNDDNIWK